MAQATVHPNHQLISSENVEGTNVYGVDGKKIGDIDHLMIEKEATSPASPKRRSRTPLHSAMTPWATATGRPRYTSTMMRHPTGARRACDVWCLSQRDAIAHCGNREARRFPSEPRTPLHATHRRHLRYAVKQHSNTPSHPPQGAAQR